MTVCKNCGGSGWDDEHMIICLHCHGSGEVEMTNEEWFTSLSTEEKAEWFVNNDFSVCVFRDCDKCEFYDKKHDDCVSGYEPINHKKMWVEWLKQPHEVGK